MKFTESHPTFWKNMCISSTFRAEESKQETIVKQAASRAVAISLLEDDSRQGKKIFLFHSIQTRPEAPPASYPMDTGGSFPEGKAVAA
jgi:hypothetical protein